MTVLIKDIIGSIYDFDDVKDVLENRTQIILRFDDKSELIFIKKNIIYVHREIIKRIKESEGKNESI